MADLIVTSGGASVGEHDWLRDVLERYGELTMWRVAIKPGKPIALGRIARAPVLALPGNPGSAFVGVHVFVAAAIRKLAGRDPGAALGPRAAERGRERHRRAARCSAASASPGTRRVPLPAQSSVVLSNIIPTEGFAIVPPGGFPPGARSASSSSGTCRERREDGRRRRQARVRARGDRGVPSRVRAGDARPSADRRGEEGRRGRGGARSRASSRRNAFPS